MISSQGDWSQDDFTTPKVGTSAADLFEREQWMGRAGESSKLLFAPWDEADASISCTHSDHDAETCAECDDD